MDEGGEAGIELEAAAGWRKGLAGVIDAGIPMAVAYARRRRRPAHGKGSSGGGIGEAIGGVLARSALIERMGSPGQRLMGLRTVDRRTGRPVTLRRATLLTGLGVGVTVARARLRAPSPASDSPERQRAGEELRREVRELREQHAREPEALEAAMMELYRRRAPAVRLGGGKLIAGVGLQFLVGRVRRRVAPTEVVRSRRPDPHSP